MELFTYYRSTSSYRVRIALALKGLDYQAVPVNLIAAQGGEHRQAAYLAVNPQGRVPALNRRPPGLLAMACAVQRRMRRRCLSSS